MAQSMVTIYGDAINNHQSLQQRIQDKQLVIDALMELLEAEKVLSK